MRSRVSTAPERFHARGMCIQTVMTPGGEAEAKAALAAADLAEMLELVVAPTEDAFDWLPERLSFLLARENFNQFLVARDAGHDIVAGNLARALFEEAMRWGWVDEDQAGRRTAFLAEAARRHGQVDEAARQLGITLNDYYGGVVEQVLNRAEGAERFPNGVQSQVAWALEGVSDQLYQQYRLLSQFTHSSLLAAASAATMQAGQMSLGRLPQVARMTMLRNAVANVAVICNGCRAGLTFDLADGKLPPETVAMSCALTVADLLQEFAPATG
jgi:hypothetical protein